MRSISFRNRNPAIHDKNDLHIHAMRLIVIIVIVLMVFHGLCFSFFESRVPLPNSIEVSVTLFSGRTNPYFVTTDSTIIFNVRSMINRMNKSSISEQNFIPIQTVLFNFWNENRLFGTFFTISEGLVLCANSVFGYEDFPSGVYIDSGRTLERYLLCRLSQSKIVDTLMLHKPLSTYIPDSLFSGCTTTSTIAPLFRTLSAAPPSMNHGCFDLLGRKILKVVPFSNNIKNHPVTENAIKKTGLKGKADNSATGLLIIKKE